MTGGGQLRPFEHPVRFGARLARTSEEAELFAEVLAVCAPCDWQAPLAQGHGRAGFERAALEHSGFRRCQAPDCQAWIIDAWTEAGKSGVVDAAESAEGNQALRFDAEGKPGYRVRYVKADAPLAEGEVRVMSHFATCASPERFRRAR